MRRLFVLFVAASLTATSVAAAESCPTMRLHALKRCCCPPSSQGHARLTCCDAKSSAVSQTLVRDRQPESQLAAAPTASAWSFVSIVPSLFVAAPASTLVASAAGPPVIALRI